MRNVQKTASNLAGIILAGGRGSRMNTSLPKVLHKIGRKTLVEHARDKLIAIGIKKIIVTVGYKANLVIQTLGKDCDYALQRRLLGTGEAVKVGLNIIPQKYGTIVVMNGDDAVFYQTKTVKKITQAHIVSQAQMSILTSNIQDDISVSGRVVRKLGKIKAVVSNDMFSSDELLKNHEVVCGFYLFNRQWLELNLPKVRPFKSGEYPITGLIDFAINQNCLNDTVLEDPDEWRSINTQPEYEQAKVLWRRVGRLR